MPFLKINPSTYRITYNIFAILSLAPLVWLQFSMVSIVLFYHPALKYFIAPVFIIIGFAIMIACIAKYFMQLSGLKKNIEPALIITGLHAWVRHPLYLGTFTLLIGIFLYNSTLANLIAVAIIISYTSMAIKLEEEKLIILFGKQYQDYCKSVPALFPKLR